MSYLFIPVLAIFILYFGNNLRYYFKLKKKIIINELELMTQAFEKIEKKR